MTKYEIIFESIKERVLNKEISIEEGVLLNKLAFEKYGEDETEYEEVVQEATRLAKEIDKKEAQLSSKIAQTQNRLKQLKNLSKSTTDRKKKDDIDNEIDDVETLIQKLKEDRDALDSQNTIKFGKEVKPKIKKIKNDYNEVKSYADNIQNQIDTLNLENDRLRSEKKILKRISNQEKISNNKRKLQGLEFNKIIADGREAVGQSKAKTEFNNTIKDGTDKKTNQRNIDTVRTNFRRSRYHIKQTDK